MPLQYFLVIPGIPGGSTDEEIADSIDVRSYSFGFSSSQSPLSIGPFFRTTFGVNAGPLHIQKFFDEASIPLFEHLVSGQLIPEMTLFVVDQTEQGNQTLVSYTFQNVSVNSFNHSGAEDADILNESVSFDYAIITIESDFFGETQSVTYNRSTRRVT